MSVEYWPTTTTTTSRTTITTTPTKTSSQITPKAFESECDTSEIDSEVILINFQKFDLTNNNNNNEDSNGSSSSRSSSNYNITTSNQGDNNTYSHQFFNLPEEEVEEKIKISDSISRIAYNKELGVDSNLTEECDI